MNPERRRAPRAFADRLAAKVARVAPDRCTDLDDRAAFLARYGAS